MNKNVDLISYNDIWSLGAYTGAAAVATSAALAAPQSIALGICTMACEALFSARLVNGAFTTTVSLVMSQEEAKKQGIHVEAPRKEITRLATSALGIVVTSGLAVTAGVISSPGMAAGIGLAVTIGAAGGSMGILSSLFSRPATDVERTLLPCSINTLGKMLLLEGAAIVGGATIFVAPTLSVGIKIAGGAVLALGITSRLINKINQVYRSI